MYQLKLMGQENHLILSKFSTEVNIMGWIRNIVIYYKMDSSLKIPYFTFIIFKHKTFFLFFIFKPLEQHFHASKKKPFNTSLLKRHD